MKPVLPGAAIGVLGGGQLGRMFAIAARRMGYRVHTFSPENDTPAGQVSDVEIESSFEDLDAVRRFAKNVQIVTFEFENIPFETAQAASEFAPVRPSGEVLHIAQHRFREKSFLEKHGFPVTPFRLVHSVKELEEAVAALGERSILKTAGFGYDGKGQRKISSTTSAQEAFRQLGEQEAVLEAFVDYRCEMSVVAARGADGSFAHYGVIQNDHKNHILDVSVAPADLPPAIVQRATEIAEGVLETLKVVGVLCVEFFLTNKDEVLVNELAPRPHNSGHLTFDACVTSQFEQQLRAVCGLPLGSTELMRPTAMANLLGDEWTGGVPRWENALKDPDVKLHLYGKGDARPGRKMGHLTALAGTPAEARLKVLAARAALTAHWPSTS
jgi:5-(carboxyamino)imidazole ribonucleotide synthase